MATSKKQHYIRNATFDVLTEVWPKTNLLGCYVVSTGIRVNDVSKDRTAFLTLQMHYYLPGVSNNIYQ